MRALNLVGKKFGGLTAISRIPCSRRTYYLCKCECGITVLVDSYKLHTGQTKSCGCWRDARIGQLGLKHGATTGYKLTPEYRTWQSMHSRCRRSSRKDYSSYQGRGIAVCDRWKSFAAFLADMGRKPGPGYSIDRIDNAKGYSPDNCRWATTYQQSRNKRNNRWITFNGTTLLMTEWADKLGLKRLTLYTRLQHGWPLELALSPELHKRGPKPALYMRQL